MPTFFYSTKLQSKKKITRRKTKQKLKDFHLVQGRRKVMRLGGAEGAEASNPKYGELCLSLRSAKVWKGARAPLL